MIKYVVTTQKGGVGKTTTVLHGAWYTAERLKKPTLVLDLDSQGNTSMTLAQYAVPGVTASRLFDPAPLPPITPVQLPETGGHLRQRGGRRQVEHERRDLGPQEVVRAGGAERGQRWVLAPGQEVQHHRGVGEAPHLRPVGGGEPRKSTPRSRSPRSAWPPT